MTILFVSIVRGIPAVSWIIKLTRQPSVSGEMLLKFQNLSLECVRATHALIEIFLLIFSWSFLGNITTNTKWTSKFCTVYGCSSAFSCTVCKSSGNLFIGSCDTEAFVWKENGFQLCLKKAKTKTVWLHIRGHFGSRPSQLLLFLTRTWLYLSTVKMHLSFYSQFQPTKCTSSFSSVFRFLI